MRPRGARTSLDSYVLPFSIIHAENESALAPSAASIMAEATATFILIWARRGREERGRGRWGDARDTAGALSGKKTAAEKQIPEAAGGAGINQGSHQHTET